MSDTCRSQCWVLKAWDAVNVSCIVNGFRKAEILSPAAKPIDNDTDDDEDDEDNIPLATIARTIPSSLAELFNSDTEEEEFDRFSNVDDHGE
ncbi:hypothetical protein DPMN_162979 [Dreissena polymorpha]|uniref:Uncharacterized protein n=1 Tax=Dreissena polymorpha TaxID=45954 RepID=A0A9D4EVW7_DREPO|nr:hypothetical protein DPMN_162979 [Dreissena polymorpha]